MRSLVVNCSWPHYNLGASKLADWLPSQGYEVEKANGDPGMFALGYDLVVLSVIFSWDAAKAREVALRVKGNSDVWCGGPGMFALKSWWEQETATMMCQGLAPWFEHQRGIYKMTFASRGCPVNCSFCIVPRIEGTEFTMYWDFDPAPILCDNNLSALPDDFQDHIIRRYQETGQRLLDANSGFEPRTFTHETYQRWKDLLKGPWRFALDEIGELDDVQRMMSVLKGERPGRKRVYVLLGNEPFDTCYERVKKVIEWEGEPFCQPITALNALEKRPQVRYDWTEQKLRDMARWANKFIWRSVPDFADYHPRKYD